MRALLAVLAFLLAALPAAAQERNWREVRDGKGVYAVLLPGKADGYNDVTAQGEAAGHNVELDNGAHYFDIYRVEAPQAPPNKAAHSAFLKEKIKASVAAANGTLLSAQPVTLAGFIGSEIVVDFPSLGGRLRQRHFVVEKRIVQQTWSGPPGQETSPDVEKFFASLKLKP